MPTERSSPIAADLGRGGGQIWSNRTIRTDGAATLSQTSIPNIDAWIGAQLAAVPEVLGVAVARCEGVRSVYSFVTESSDDAYDRILPVEARVRSVLNTTVLNFSIRDLQGRPLEQALPPGTKLVFSR